MPGPFGRRVDYLLVECVGLAVCGVVMMALGNGLGLALTVIGAAGALADWPDWKRARRKREQRGPGGFEF
jgi:hypothetical protein